MCGRRLQNLPDITTNCDITDEDFEMSREDVSKRMQHLSQVMNHFWQRWTSEYLLGLRESHRHSQKRKGSNTVSVGDVVIIHDPDQPRGFWRLGVVEQLVPSTDGQVRGAVVKVKSKKRKPSTLRRPVQLLYPLEIKDTSLSESKADDDVQRAVEEDSTEEKQVEADGEETGEEMSLARSCPRRRAAVQADRVRKDWLDQLT